MSSKIASFTALILIMLFDISYFISINGTSNIINTNETSIGPQYFPDMLAVILIILCLLGLVQTARKKDKKIDIPHFKMILFTFVLTVLFVISWRYFGWFYFQSFVYLTILNTVYRHKPGKFLYITATGALFSLIVTGLIFVVFDLVMKTTF